MTPTTQASNVKRKSNVDRGMRIARFGEKPPVSSSPNTLNGDSFGATLRARMNMETARPAEAVRSINNKTLSFSIPLAIS